ncbi:probable NADH kinase isoform X1 [Pistacia vera]|uniref:probable NADH kinase isoform X1 n=1 Tax=Pistacia vera TaxID=55513 RepID=UPI0012630A49|nr:probable NADH kinase isoform X1 [Pistacia vera]
MDDSVPVLGVNSDPTHVEEVEAFSNEFDATRSTGYLCAATVKNFEQEVKGCCWYLVEGRNHGGLLIYMPKLYTLMFFFIPQVIDKILDGQLVPSILSRISVCVNSEQLPTFALNDILVAHPCPATVSRFSFKIKKDGLPCSPLVNCRSSGLRVSTAAGSTAAMLSAGGFIMPTLSQDLQYMVREPISPPAAYSNLMHGLVKSDESMEATWFSKEGFIYIDGSHIFHSIQNGDTIELSSKAPGLKVFLPPLLLL